MKNLCGKTRTKDNPYEIWEAGDWTWYVLKKWQADDNKPYARAFCLVVTPYTGDLGDLGDTYIADYKSVAQCVYRDESVL